MDGPVYALFQGFSFGGTAQPTAGSTFGEVMFALWRTLLGCVFAVGMINYALEQALVELITR